MAYSKDKTSEPTALDAANRAETAGTKCAAGCGLSRIRPAWLEVDLDRLAENTRETRRLTRAGALICASMKANAYGHGAVQAAKTVLSSGADRLSVALLDEGIALRAAGIRAPVLILGVPERARAGEAVTNDLTQTVASLDDARALSDAALRAGRRAVVHVKADTGMGRIGFACGAADTEAAAVEEILAAGRLPGVEIEGIFTHFATADEADRAFAERQLAVFLRLCGALESRGLRIPIRHAANSAAIIGFPESHLEMVRPGIILYGGAGELPGAHHRAAALRQVMALKARVVQVKEISKGMSIGYGRQFVADGPARIATLPLGYADGYSRAFSCGRGELLIGGSRAPVAGRVCMDQCMADVTRLGRVRQGDEAVLFGAQGGAEITLSELAERIGTINYELMCAVSQRVPRIYLRGGRPAEA
ncbi:MAG: alanine racemase [Clostridiales bacterium]|jgi:alanine racemase|nr:alanine racemase [Clostridiales bacterium]